MLAGSFRVASGVRQRRFSGVGLRDGHEKPHPRLRRRRGRPRGPDRRFAAPFGGVRSFQADGSEAVYLQDRQRNWYRAELIGPCQGLPWAFGIAIDNRGSSTVDRFSTLIVEGDRCKIESLTRSGPPPKKHKARPR
jgi:Family of unknown function (DUF6491)